MDFADIFKYLLVLAALLILSLGIIYGEGAIRDKMKEVRSIVIRYSIYLILDWGLMLLSVVLVAFMKKFEASVYITTVFMWIFDFITAYLLLIITLKSKQDLTLGRQYRKSHELIKLKSKISGFLSLSVLVVKGIIWDGPERLVEFWHIELKSTKRKIIVLLIASLFQAIFWTTIYWLGLELI